MVIRYKVYSQQHARAGTNIQHVIYNQLARAGQNTNLLRVVTYTLRIATIPSEYYLQ